MSARLLELFFLPPMAIARLGSSPTPVDSFRWVGDAISHSHADTVIEPAISLRVLADGSVAPYLPSSIVFKDADGGVRPVAPFLELWATLEDSDTGKISEVPLTLALLAELKGTLGDIQYEITAANGKAARRTSYAFCGFMARETIDGNDHTPRQLLAISPHTSGQEPLVTADKPIPLGSFQVLRPAPGKIEVEGTEVDRSILRVRFTPPEGIVYGPPEATSAPAPQVQPGQFEAPIAEYGRIHEIVAPQHRIVSGKTPWSRYVMLNGQYEDPQPQDGYDGANVGEHTSWGCVDDISDTVLVASLGLQGRCYRAFARIFTSPPDFAPDRRPIFSIADDVEDRELPRIAVTKESFKEAVDEVVDIFKRAFETASLFNLDALRGRALCENQIRVDFHGGCPPEGASFGKESMTKADVDYVNKLPTLAPMEPAVFTNATENAQLPYTTALPFVHAPLQNREILLDLLRRQGDQIKRLLRPPYGRFADLPPIAADRSNPRFRDPRVFRDQLHDMRMPPYMRDAARQPLSLTHRQYRLIEALIDYLAVQQQGGSNGPG